MLTNLARKGIGGFVLDGGYSSSSEYDAQYGWLVYNWSSSTDAYAINKSNSYRVRAGRAF